MIRFYTLFIGLLLLFSSCAEKDVRKRSVKSGSKSRTFKDSTLNTNIMSDVKSINEVMGMFDPIDHKDFVTIDGKYSDRNDRIMHKEAYDAFIKMWNHAKSEGIKLSIKSATRNFNYQKGIWERKWNGTTKVSGQDLSKTMNNPVSRALKILEYSSMPGTSRHHWGTDIDLNAFENSYFETGQGLKEYNWLSENASTYGFCQPYTPKGIDRPDGYNEEKWHWSYLPVANQYMDQIPNINNTMISGFNGSETASEIGVVEKYMLGIHSTCKK